jgi:hypothetical protein
LCKIEFLYYDKITIYDVTSAVCYSHIVCWICSNVSAYIAPGFLIHPENGYWNVRWSNNYRGYSC